MITRSARGRATRLPPGTAPLLATLLLGVFIGAVDLAIVAPALRTIGTQFGVDDRQLSWVFTIYVLANVAALPLMGKLSDRLGRRPVFLLDLALFALGSALAAFAPSFEVLLLGRAVQATGAGGLFPVATAVIGDVIPAARRGIFLALTGSVWGIATVIGPPIGGVLTQNAGWPWIFILNLPLCVVAATLAWRTIPMTGRPARPPLDVAGLVLLSASLSLLTFAVVQMDAAAPGLGLGEPAVLIPVGVALVTLILWVPVERRAADPVVRLELLARRQLLLAYTLSLFTGLSEAALLYLPTLASLRLGIDPQAASLFLVIGALALFIGTPISGVCLDRFGSRTVLVGGALLAGGSMLVLGALADNVLLFIPPLILGGFGYSALLGTPLRYIVTNETSPGERTTALALLSVTTTAGIAVGSALTGAIAGSGREDGAGYAAAYVVIGLAAVGAAGLALLLKGRAAERRAAGHSAPEGVPA